LGMKFIPITIGKPKRGSKSRKAIRNGSLFYFNTIQKQKAYWAVDDFINAASISKIFIS